MKLLRNILWIVGAQLMALALATPATALQWGTGSHFDYMSRCRDIRNEPARRVGYCKSALGSGWLEASNDVYILVLIGDAYLDEHDYRNALASYNEAMERGEFSGRIGNALQRRGELYAVTGDTKAALADVDHFFKFMSNDPAAYNYSCWIKAIIGKELDAALSDCNAALKAFPDNANFLDSRGLAEFKKGDLKSAAADYARVVEKYRDFVTSRYMQGVIKKLNGDVAGGNDDIDAAVKRDPLIVQRMSDYGIVVPAPKTTAP